MSALVLAIALAVQAGAQPAAPAAPAPQARPEIAAAVLRGVAAYNAQDLAYFEAAVAPDAVYIMDNGLGFPSVNTSSPCSTGSSPAIPGRSWRPARSSPAAAETWPGRVSSGRRPTTPAPA